MPRSCGTSPRQTHRAGRSPDAQGEDAGTGRPRDDVLQARGHEDQEGQGGAGGDPARRAGDRRGPDRELPHGAQAHRRGRPGPGGAGEGRGHDRRGPSGAGGPGRGGVGGRGREAAGGPSLPGRPRPGEGADGAGRRVRRGHAGGGGFRRVRQAVRADRKGLRPPRQLLGSAAVRADRPGPGGDVRPGCCRDPGVHRDQRGQPGVGRSRARPASPGGPRRVHHRLQRGGR
jgi:hypothetical protein